MADFTTAAGQNEGLFVRLHGGVGNADVTKGGTRGGDGGVITITNSGTIAFGALSVPTAEGTDDGSNPGVWDDPGRAVAIYAASIGGTGGGGQGSVGGSDGGNGGHAGPLTITNSGTLAMTGVTMANGGAGILGSIVTGGGGEQNDTAGDQHGGAAGDGEALTITNSGLITLSAPSAAHYVWGIGAENIGGVGGKDNGEGGNGGTTTITNTGVVSVTVQSVVSAATIDVGVRGIYGASFGGPGEASSDGSDDGGIGEGGSAVSISTSANVSVTANGLAAPQDGYNPTTNDYATDTSPVSVPANLGKIQQSGALVAVSKGGDGGSGPQTLGSGNNVGGQGASAGVVTVAVTNGAVIATNGNYVAGVVELSFGGLGGDGREDSDGAVAGNGGAVGILMDGGTSITTNGADAYGVVARSQGGNGGDYIPSSGTINTNAARAGQGGAGGELNLTFGDVVNDQLGAGVADASGRVSINTSGDSASGVIAQSIGGAGGNVGNSFDLFGQGTDSTGAGGNAGAVFVRGGVDVATTGNAARGVLLQSIGGAGGMGGSAGGVSGGDDTSDATQLPAASEDDSDSGINVNLAIQGAFAGNGGDGGNGGAIGDNDTRSANFSLGGTVLTYGDYSDAVVVQSIGGGGGVGGNAASQESEATVKTNIVIGSVGGGAGDGGSITLAFDNLAVQTQGAYAFGTLLQSIGAGGGQGGSGSKNSCGLISLGSGNSVADYSGASAGCGTLPSTTSIRTQTGASGNGGNITTEGTDNVATIVTTGNDAHALVAQSTGGGGGTAGAGSSNSEGDQAFTVALGASGGATGSGGTVTLDGTFKLSTTGARAIGLVAQSIGGGGGLATLDVSNAGSGEVHLGADGANGSGAAVTLDLSDESFLLTTGQAGHGIVAQSIGGGGGIAGDTSVSPLLTTDYTRNDATNKAVANGAGAAVTVTSAATIQVSGIGAIGIVAQSIAGGGGLGGDASGSFAGLTSIGSGSAESSTVTVTNDGTITATGENGIGIFAQSQGANDNGSVVVNVNGDVTGGSGAQGAGIMIAAGKVQGGSNPGNALNVASGATVSALSGTAVIYQGDSNSATYSGLTVNNAGTISGNIDGYYLDGTVISGLGGAAFALDAPAGKAAVTVNNLKVGVLVDASSYGADVINAGSLIVGKADLPDTLQIAGAFTQTSTGVTTAAVDFFRGVGDLIKVSGQTTLDGALEIVPLTTYKGARQQIVDAEGEIAGAFSEIKSTLFDYVLSTDEKGDLWVEVAGAHFKSVPNLTDNQEATAAYLGEVFDTKDVTLRELFAAADCGKCRFGKLCHPAV